MSPSTAIELLRRLGMTEAEIGDAVGARQSTINRIRHGVMEPSYSIGHALVALADSKRRKRLRSKAA